MQSDSGVSEDMAPESSAEDQTRPPKPKHFMKMITALLLAR
jgi:hypothetical protein